MCAYIEKGLPFARFVRCSGQQNSQQEARAHYSIRTLERASRLGFRKDSPMRRIRPVETELAGLADTKFEIAALAKILSPTVVGETLAAAGKVAQRVRKLPPEVVTWLVVGMGLFRGLSIENVLARVGEGLGSVVRWGAAELPCATAITHARDRLGWDVVRTIFRGLAEFLTKKHESVAAWRGHVVNVLDGSCFLVPDSAANDAEFGRPGTTRGGARSAYPSMRSVLVVGAWTHLIRHAVLGPYRVGELTLAAELVPDLEPGTVLLMDRAYFSYAWLAGIAARGVQFVVRAKLGSRALKLAKLRRLGNGDARGLLRIPPSLKRKRPDLPDALEVRVVTYTVKTRGGRRTIKLVTSLLATKEKDYPADEIASLFRDRWEGELSFRELKTHQVEKRVAFRSKTPDRVRQEAWGLLVAYNCVRGLMAEAAEFKALQPRRLSFVDCLTRARAAVRTLAGRDPAGVYEQLLADMATCVLPKRRVGRNCPRAVKIKMSNYPRKRPGLKTVAPSRDVH